MSKNPCPLKLKTIVLLMPKALHFSASAIADFTACAASGAGIIPSVLVKTDAALNQSVPEILNDVWQHIHY